MSPVNTFLASLFMSLFLRFCNSTDTITLTRPVNDGDVLVSSGESFALGFFSPTNSSNRYVGIWYNKIPEQTVVWVANRDNPISNSTGVLSVDETGNIVLHERGQTIAYWSSNISAVVNGDFSAQLLDTGNLVLFQGQNRQVFLWQSFDHPTNTFLPEMKFGLDRKTGLNRFYTSWKSSENPGIGAFSYKMEFVGSTQLFLYNGMTQVWRTGSWTGRGWSGVPQMGRTFIFDISFIDNNDEVVIIDHVPNSTTFSRLVMNESGIVERLTWEDANRRWNMYYSAPIERCDSYSICGPFGYCDPTEPNEIDCKCFPGYEPRSPQDWEQRDGSEGCTTKLTTHMCEDGDDFIELPYSKVPDTSAARVDMSIGLEGCKALCLKNCSCVGYANADISGAGRGCITWHGELIDTRTFPSWGQSFYVRVDAAEFAKNALKNQKSSHTNRFLVIGIPMITVGFLISACISYYIKKKRTNQREHEAEFIFKSSIAIQGSFLEKDLGKNVDIHVFDLSTIVAATDNFSPLNKLGEGGFGSVYKGKLRNGNEIAAKRLSQSSSQGMEEFKNEVTLIAKLQHRNLVRLLGYCFQKEEQMLIYEYLPNKGLDSYIFDQEKGSILDWKKRFQIILGIVRGLLYLHQDSRVKIIHRDIKASNVLLDAALNPKISDFGMAKIFGGDKDEAKTRRVVGTYGYMSPEYAMEGLFSVKSDVYSFGVLVLEIISGRKNTSYYMEKSLNLIGHVWDLWKQDRALSVVDSSLGNEYDTREVLLCIHVGILCLQESANDRPTMTDVASMLRNHETRLPSPNQPAFIFGQSNYATDPTPALASAGVNSIDDDTITIVQAR